ncbi:hypothetical protein RGQ15_08105 [Paracoccus sp. MBLB3053]|uniref:DUF4169 family protein n=1 Tax=Paracoccus aurantius TaxID=3073814 RepID=A0ABU2HR72_9RHOB|nr:hypothetical protein [Paracoccus sp. MBLB3053]MDS9467536.1 hypothetical protein [Paracoccus sp. MBLB3053]
MTKGPRKPSAAEDREARLKAALRANLARRKAQGRARAVPVQEDLPKNEQDGPETRSHGRSPENEE